MLTRTHTRDQLPVGPQCPEGQEEGYKLGWYQGQGAMIDAHDGTPCQVIRMQHEIERLRSALHEIAELSIPSGDIYQATTIAHRAIDKKEASE